MVGLAFSMCQRYFWYSLVISEHNRYVNSVLNRVASLISLSGFQFLSLQNCKPRLHVVQSVPIDLNSSASEWNLTPRWLQWYLRFKSTEGVSVITFSGIHHLLPCQHIYGWSVGLLDIVVVTPQSKADISKVCFVPLRALWWWSWHIWSSGKSVVRTLILYTINTGALAWY